MDDLELKVESVQCQVYYILDDVRIVMPLGIQNGALL